MLLQVLSRDRDAHGFLPSFAASEEGKAHLVSAEKDAGKSKAAARLVLWHFGSFLANQSPVKTTCILKFVVWGRNEEWQ